MSILDQNSGGASDPSVASVCAAEGRVLLTFDIDFADIRAYPPEGSPGIVVFRLKSQDRKRLFKAIEGFLSLLDTASPTHQLWIVEENKLRIRN